MVKILSADRNSEATWSARNLISRQRSRSLQEGRKNLQEKDGFDREGGVWLCEAARNGFSCCGVAAGRFS